MNRAFDPNAGGPDYMFVRLADHLSACIEDGILPVGAMLPNERRLAMEYEVSVGTVRRATRLLRDRGLIVTLPSRGSYVRRATRTLDTEPALQRGEDVTER